MKQYSECECAIINESSGVVKKGHFELHRETANTICAQLSIPSLLNYFTRTTQHLFNSIHLKLK